MKIISDSATNRIAIQCVDEDEMFSMLYEIHELLNEWEKAKREKNG